MPRVPRLLRWRMLGLIALLGLFFFQAVAASPHNSITFDEQYHVTPGYVYLKTGDLRFHHDQNPPLFESIISLPLLLRTDLNLPTDHPAYALWSDVYLFSDVFLWHANADAQGIVTSGRWVVAGFGALLGLLLFVWGKQMYGEAAGWIAAFLLAFDPNFIANSIPTLDLGLAFTSALAIWRLWRYLKRPTLINIVLAGLALGFALSTKFLSVMLIPSFALILMLHPPPDKGPRTNDEALQHSSSVTRRLSPRLLRRGAAFVGMLLLAWLVVWITYRFQFGPVNGAGLPVPAPQYFESFIGMFLKSSEGRANFLMGQVSVIGWWYYFIVALLIKTPLPTLIVVSFALIRWSWRREWRESSVLIVPVLLFFGGASVSKLQLGYRYILPVLPFLFLMAARVGQDIILSHGRRLIKVAYVALAAWFVAGTVSIFPHYLSYFNELIGGPANGYKYLVDSNVDWGQDLPALQDWIDQHQPDRLHFGFFGSAYPDRYGVHAISIPSYPLNAAGHEVDGFTSYSLEPGQYALSATLLRIGLVSKQFNLYQAFQSMTPVDRAGYSILIYDVRYPLDASIDRAVIGGPIASDVPPNDLGMQPDHPLRAKWCAYLECFIFTPHPARYIVRDFIPFELELAKQARAQARPISANSRYSVFDLDATSLIQDKVAALHDAPATTPGGIAVTLPINFDNGLSLVGYEVTNLAKVSKPSQGLDVLTYWRVDGPITPPLKIFVHLLDPQGNIRGQDDNFGAAVRMLESGDLVIQHHPIKIAADAPAGTYRLEVGLYNPDTLDRFQAHPSALPSVDRILLSTVEIER